MTTKKKTRGAFEIRRNADRSIDEFVARDVSLVHIEQMASDYWWMSVERGGRRMTIHFYTGTGDDTGAPITCRIEEE